MSRLLVTTLNLLLILALFAPPVGAQEPIEAGLTWLREQQQPDGGFTNGFSEGSDLGTTGDVILAMVAAGEDPADWVSEGGNTPLDYLKAQLNAGAIELLGLKAKVTLALAVAGERPARFADVDPLADLRAAYDETAGSFGSSIFDQALIILTLFHAGDQVPDRAVEYLVESQHEEGGWALFGGSEEVPDTNTTALAVQALIVAGHRGEAVEDALAYLRTVQNDDGGFPYQNPSEYGTATDANSTALVLQALLAAGEPLTDWAPQGSDPREALLALQDPESGAFQWQAGTGEANVLATAQAIPPLAEVTFVNLPGLEAYSTGTPTATATPTPIPTPLPAAGAPPLLPLAVVVAGLLVAGIGLALRRR
jgi:hypothetical protein